MGSAHFLTQFPQGLQTFRFMVKKRDEEHGFVEPSPDLGQIFVLLPSSFPEKGVVPRILWQQVIHGDHSRLDPDLLFQVLGSPPGLDDRRIFREHDEDKGALRCISHLFNDGGVLAQGLSRGLLCERPEVDEPFPIRGKLQEPQRMPRRCRVEDDDVIARDFEIAHEFLEGSHLFGAG